MARRGKVAVSITADASGLKKGVRNAEGDLGRLQRVSVGTTRGMSAAFKTAGGVIAGAAVADQIRQTVQAAQDAEVAQAKVKKMLENAGLSWAKYGDHIDAVITKQSRLTGLDDEELAQSFANMVRTTKDVNEALKLNALAADVARTKGMDLAGAQSLIARVYNGSFNGLKRLGIAITPVTTAQDKLKESTKHATIEQTRAAKEADKTATRQKALAQLQKQFGGQAEAYGKMAAGAQDRFRVAIENLREKLGEKLLPILTKVTTKVTKFVEQMTDGTGAGGRFVTKLKDIADRMKPIVKFFTDHPKIIALAIGAWATYRIAAAAAMAATRLKALGMFKGLGPSAGAAGTVAGRTFGDEAAKSGAGRMRGARWSNVGNSIGGAIGKAMGAVMLIELGLAFREWAKQHPALAQYSGSGGWKELLNDLTDAKGPVGDEIKIPDPRKKKPNNSTQSPFTPSTPLGTLPSGPSRAPDNRPRAHTSSVMAHAAASTGGAQPHPDDIVSAITERANRIDAAHVPYQWGGGHGGRLTGGKVIPMDCSGAVSAALGIDPRVSGDFASWGSPGDGGSTGITVYANRTHVLMKINGRFWGTSRSNPGGGAGWIDGGVSSGYLSGFTARHMAGRTSGRPAAGSTFLSGVRKAVRRPTATLGGTLSRAPAHTVGHTAATGDTGFTQTNEGAEPTQGQTDLKRKYQIAVRLQDIARLLKRAKGGQRAQLLAERGRLTTELAAIGATDAAGLDAVPGAPQYLAKLDRAAAEAEATPDTADDLVVAKETLTARENILAYMKGHGFSDADIATATRDVTAARDAVNAGPAAAQQALADEIKSLRQAIEQQNNNAKQVMSTSVGVIWKAMADMISGQIAGVGYSGRLATAGDGSIARW